jgi:superfamily II DNA or RNA helicase
VSAALTSNSDERTRATVLDRLLQREINIVFAVDIFNEGVDVPEVDTVLFLRPTESATVFLKPSSLAGIRREVSEVWCPAAHTT